MDKKTRIAMDGLRQMADWARAWVENETPIEELKDSELEAKEIAALALIGAILMEKN